VWARVCLPQRDMCTVNIRALRHANQTRSRRGRENVNGLCIRSVTKDIFAPAGFDGTFAPIYGTE